MKYLQTVLPFARKVAKKRKEPHISTVIGLNKKVLLKILFCNQLHESGAFVLPLFVALLYKHAYRGLPKAQKPIGQRTAF